MESKNKFRAFLEEAPDAFFAHDLGGRFTDVNKQACKSLGYSREELLKMTVLDVEQDFDLTAAKAVWVKPKEGESISVLGHHRRKDGTVFPVETHICASLIDGKRIVFGLVRDITESQQAKARQESLTKLYSALSEINQAIVRMDDETKLFPLVCRMAVDFGGLKMAWIGKHNEAKGLIEPVVSYGQGVEYLEDLVISVHEGIPEGLGPTAIAFREAHKVIVNDFKMTEMTAPWHERAAHYGWGSSATFPVPRAGKPFAVFIVYHENKDAFDEEIIGLLEEMSRDVSFALDNFDREKERKLGGEILRISEEKFSKTFRNSPNPISITKLSDGQIIEINDAWSRITGYSREEAVGHSAVELGIWVSPIDRTKLVNELKKNGRVNGLEFVFKTKTNEVTCLVSAETVEIQNEPCLILVAQDITDLKHALETIKEQNNFLNAIFESEPECVKVVAPNGELMQMNRAGLSMLEVDSLDEAQQFGLHKFILPSHRKSFVDFHKDVCAGSSGVLEFPITGKKGSQRWLETHATPLRNATGEIVALLGITRDITERRQAEHVLQLANERLSLALRAAGAGTWDWDMTSGKLSWSNELFRLFGLDPEKAEATFDTWRGVLHPEDLQHAEDRITEAVHNRIAHISEYRIVLGSGEARWIQALGNTTYDEHSAAVRMAGLCIDITTQKQAEEKLQLFARVFAEAYEGIVITDASANIIKVNPAFCEITGYGSEEAIGQNLRDLDSGRQPPEFYTAMWESLSVDGYWQGEIWSRKKQGAVYAARLTISALRDKLGKTVNFVGLFSDITQTKQQQQTLELMAHYDALTQLPNRVLFADRFKQAISLCKRDKSLLGICYLDLDGFKQINDTHGHEAGDHMLIELALRIKSAMRGEDTVSRLGGDEFALLLGGLDTVEQCFNTLERVHQAIAQPYVIDGQTVALGASSGVTIYPMDDAEPDILLRHADQAMYKAKLEGRNHFQLFDPEHDLQVQNYRNQLHLIEGAFERREFCLHYQPKVNMRTGEVVGAEALIRWNHPERGVVPPLDFLPVIEGTSLEIKVGNWVIEEALRQMEEWKQTGLEIKVSVNISPRHLQGEDFFMHLETALAQYPDIPSHQLELEVLESSAMEDLPLVSRVISDCHRRLGIKFALDDFGTGYSSLTHIRNLDVSIVKVDQSFVRDMIGDPDDYSIVEAVLGLSKAFRREVIAEGVETKEHGLLLMNMECTLAQGYAIARPMPPSSLANWLATYDIPEEWKARASMLLSPVEVQVQLLRIESNHWLEQIGKCLVSNDESEVRWPIMLKETCHCGRWVEHVKQEKDFDSEWLKRLEQSHEELHRIGNELMHLHQAGEVRQARSGIDRLRAAYQTVEKILDQLF
jgi:diguanylate cyclase (GGDEF)-like protein/PAS domain S-box-containing protein